MMDDIRIMMDDLRDSQAVLGELQRKSSNIDRMQKTMLARYKRLEGLENSVLKFFNDNWDFLKNYVQVNKTRKLGEYTRKCLGTPDSSEYDMVVYENVAGIIVEARPDYIKAADRVELKCHEYECCGIDINCNKHTFLDMLAVRGNYTRPECVSLMRNKLDHAEYYYDKIKLPMIKILLKHIKSYIKDSAAVLEAACNDVVPKSKFENYIS